MSDALAVSFARGSLDVQQRFATPLIVVQVNEAEALKAELSDLILRRAAEDAGVHRSKEGGWQSDADFETWGGSSVTALLDSAKALASHFTGLDDGGGVAQVTMDWRMNAWANVNDPGHSNRPHHHPAAFWSGVYWIDDGGDPDLDPSGEFVMSDPRGVLPAFYAPRLRYMTPGGLSAGREDFIEPRTGTMVLFPSWLIHAVRPYRGRRKRLSIAFNLSV